MAEIADPERRLALLYAPAPTRPALAALWRLDERFGQVVASTSEAMIGRIRLAWWREALERLDSADAPAEPLLAEVARAILPRGVTGARLAEMEAGWAALIDSPPDPAVHARVRGGHLFVAAADLLDPSVPHLQDGVRRAGERWALADLAHRLSDPAVRAEARRLGQAIAPPRVWPRTLRSLGALSALASRDLASDTRVQGTPRRAARMLLHRLTGR